ncbi:hypothetical protein HK101_011033 [Irineochytrium annulatum]|nr:hypothetical protein HK101_011033 [Irineochytrium annulatum]
MADRIKAEKMLAGGGGRAKAVEEANRKEMAAKMGVAAVPSTGTRVAFAGVEELGGGPAGVAEGRSKSPSMSFQDAGSSIRPSMSFQDSLTSGGSEVGLVEGGHNHVDIDKTLPDMPAEPPTASPDPLPRTTPTAPIDVLIIGAGITGLSTASHLLTLLPRTRNRVVCLESRNQLSPGATGRNGGLLWPGPTGHVPDMLGLYGGAPNVETLLRFDAANVEAIAELARDAKAKGWADLQFHRFDGGGITALETDRDMERARIDVAWFKAHGLGDGYEVLEEEEARRVTGYVGTMKGALVNGGACHVVPARVVEAQGRLFIERGGTIVKGCEVRRVTRITGGAVADAHRQEVRWDGVHEVETSLGVVHARVVVHACNAWTAALLPGVPVTPVRNQVVVTGPLEKRLLPSFAFSANSGYEYMSGRDDGRIVLGGMRYLTEGMEWGVCDDAALDPRVSAALKSYLGERFPSLEGKVEVEREWAGIMGWSPDGLPFVGVVPDSAGGQIVAAGFSGHGMPRALLCGRAVAQMVAGVNVDVPHFPKELFALTSGRMEKLRKMGDQEKVTSML